MNLATVMEEIGARLRTITGPPTLRVSDFGLVGAITPPAAILSWPDELDYDMTYARGADRLTFPLTLLVGKASLRASRDALGAYCDGSGAQSIKAKLEAGNGTYASFDQ
jgi:hypothetical protein